MSARADRAAATRTRILDAVRALVSEGVFLDATVEEIAARAGVTRVTIYRTFGSKHELLEGLSWHMLAKARIDLVDTAHQHPDVRVAVRRVLRANCRMFADLAEGMLIALELSRYDADMRAVIDASYHGRRHRSMEALAARVVKEGAAAPGWARNHIADALVVLSSHEAFQTLVERRGHSVDAAGELLYRLAGAFFAQ